MVCYINKNDFTGKTLNPIVELSDFDNSNFLSDIRRLPTYSIELWYLIWVLKKKNFGFGRF